MIDKQILIAEDDMISGKLITNWLESLGYQVTLAKNGKQAIEFFTKRPFPIVITDYNMPEVNGGQVIDYLKEKEDEPTIMVLTNHSESALIIEIMKKGVYDFIVKPIAIQELALKISRAFEIHSMKRLERIMNHEKELRLESHLEWIKYKERAGGIGNSKKVNQNLFESLKTSFNQGTGFGSLVSLLKMVSQTAKREGNIYQIDADIMDLIQSNMEMADKALSTFAEIENILNGTFDCEVNNLSTIMDDLSLVIGEIAPFVIIKRQEILLSEKKATFDRLTANVNRYYLNAAITEILLNACKFSIPDSSIHVLTYVEMDYFIISVYNLPMLNADISEGIPLAYENLVFEPFYRLTKFVFDDYNTLDFGLGLTKVESIVKRLNAKIEIRNIMDHLSSDTKPVTKVICRLSIPLFNS